ncbi:MAG TPA: gamma-glutamyltransferase, partial [Longimicrobiales bacterium]|nr:gamma-glutamyltransferase [Longimicrobiales bacterium]
MIRTTKRRPPVRALSALAAAALLCALPAAAQQTHKPVLHGKHWMAITGKPLAATAGARIFEQGGNAVDAAAAMLAATATMWDVLSWGGETQALIYDPRSGEVVGINALGVAPTGATAEFYTSRGLRYPPQYGPLAAVTPGTPGGLMVMLAEYGKLSLGEVLAPAIQMAREGYPIEEQAVRSIRANRDRIMEWPYSRAVFLPNTSADGEPAPPEPGQIFTQPELAATLEKLVEAERRALAEGKSRGEAIRAAHERFYRGDIAAEIARATQEQGGLITAEDLARWEVRIEEPVHTRYKGIDVYKLTHWTQGPVLLQALDMLEDMPLREWGYNSARYIHALYQVMNLAFADRDFYYGDPFFPPEEPISGLHSKEYARARAAGIDWERNDPHAGPGDPYPFQGETNPFAELLRAWPPEQAGQPVSEGAAAPMDSPFRLAGGAP